MDNSTTILSDPSRLWKLYQSTKEVSEHWLFTLGFAAYVLVLLPLVKYRKDEFLGRPFYKICLSMAVADIVSVILEEGIGPISSLLKDIQLCREFGGLFYAVRTWMWFSNCIHQLLIALDRFVAIVLPVHSEQKVFSGRFLVYWLVMAWLSSFAVVAPMFTNQYKFFCYPDFSMYHNFADPYAMLYGLVRDWIIQPLILIATVALQVVTGVKVRKHQNTAVGDSHTHGGNSQNQSLMAKGEIRLLVQSLLVTMPQLVCMLGFFPALMVPGLPFWLYFLLLEIGYLGANLMVVINPFVYMAFSSELRKKVVKYYFNVDPDAVVHQQGKSARFTQKAAKRASLTQALQTVRHDEQVESGV